MASNHEANTETRNLRAKKEENFQLRRNLEALDHYMLHSEEIEQQRSRMSREVEEAKRAGSILESSGISKVGASAANEVVVKMEQKVRKYEEDNLPAELRGQDVLPKEEDRNVVEQAYAASVGKWTAEAKNLQQKALEKIAEENKTPEQKKLEEENARLKAENERLQNANAELARRLEETQAEPVIANRERDEARAEAARLARELAKFSNQPVTPEEWADMPPWIQDLYRDSLARPPAPVPAPAVSPDEIDETPEAPADGWGKIRGMGRLFGNTLIGAAVGTAGRTLIGWEAFAFGAGTVRSAFSRARELRNEGFESVMRDEWRRGHTGLRGAAELYLNAERTAGRQAARLLVNAFELGDRDGTSGSKEIIASWLMGIPPLSDQNPDYMASALDMLDKPENITDRRILRDVAENFGYMYADARWEENIGGYRIRDLMKKEGVVIDDKTFGEILSGFNNALGHRVWEFVTELNNGDDQDKALAATLNAKMTETRSKRLTALKTAYFVTGSLAGGVKALGVAELFNLAVSNLLPRGPEPVKAGGSSTINVGPDNNDGLPPAVGSVQAGPSGSNGPVIPVTPVTPVSPDNSGAGQFFEARPGQGLIEVMSRMYGTDMGSLEGQRQAWSHISELLSSQENVTTITVWATTHHHPEVIQALNIATEPDFDPFSKQGISVMRALHDAVGRGARFVKP